MTLNHLALSNAAPDRLLAVAQFLDNDGYGSFEATAFARFFQKPAYHFLSLSDPSSPEAGYQAGCLLSLSGDEAEIIEIAVAGTFRAQGFGTKLLGHVIAFVRDRGGQRLFLEVAADNHPALALYHRHQFQECGRRIGYYQPIPSENDKIIAKMPKIDALIMELSL